MGNIISHSSIISSSSSLNASYLDELQGFEYQKSLSNARFMKTIQFKLHDNTFYTVKVFIKPQIGISLNNYVKKLEHERELLSDLSNTFPYHQILETERTGFLIRQHLYSNLYDRINTQPFLNLLDKKWITFQMILGVSQAHEAGIVHGDIKSQNFLLTTWNWIYLTDFASYKPVYLPEDNPADFSFFFDTSGRRSCYIAPERFYSPTDNLITGFDTMELEKSMDIFSLGCTIAELFLEGKPLFTFPQLLKYRKRQYDPIPELKKIEDVHIRSLIQSMIRLDPSSRLNATEYIHSFDNKAFPNVFGHFLHPLVANLLSLEGQPKYVSDMRVHYFYSKLKDFILQAIHQEVSNRDTLIEQQKEEMGINKEIKTKEFSISFIHKPLDSLLAEHQRAVALVISTILCTQIRSCQRPSSILKVIHILDQLGPYLDDNDILDRVLPFIVHLLESSEAKIRAKSIRFVAKVLATIESILPADSNYFPEYIIPYTRHLAKDEDFHVRLTYASSLGTLAQASVKFLELSELIYTTTFRHLKTLNTNTPTTNTTSSFSNLNKTSVPISSNTNTLKSMYDQYLKDLQDIFQEDLVLLMMDSHSHVKRALLSEISELCLFFGRNKTNDLILSHIITYLNDPDPLLRASFFEHINSIGTYVGQLNFEEYILPLMMQSVTDADEYVVERVIRALNVAVELHLTQKSKMKEIVHKVLPLIYHPNDWIHRGTVALVKNISKSLSFLDFECFVYPLLRQFLVCEIPDINLLEECIKERMSRKHYEDLLIKMSKSSSAEKDSLEIHHLLQQFNVNAVDKEKLLALKSYIYRVSMSMKSSESKRKPEQAFELMDHSTTPQTVFLTMPESYQELLDRYESQRVQKMESNFNSSNTNNTISSIHREDSGRIGSGANLPSLFSRSSSSLLSGSLQQKRNSASPGTSPTWIPPASVVSSTTSSSPGLKTYSSHPNLVITSKEASSKIPSPASIHESITPKIEKKEDEETPINHEDIGVFNTLDHILYQKTLELFPRPIPALEPQIPTIHDFIPNYPVSSRASSLQSMTEIQTLKWRPVGQLIYQFKEHKDKIQQLLISPDHSFFASVSNDRTIKIWDTRRLEKNVVNRSRLTIQASDKLTSATFCERTHAIAYATRKGDINISRIEYVHSDQAPKYHGLETVYKSMTICQDTSSINDTDIANDYITQVVHGSTDLYSLLVFSTKYGYIRALDLRSNKVIWSIQIPKHYGYPSCLSLITTDMLRVVVGTVLGVVSVWDIKHEIHSIDFPLCCWQHPYQCRIEKMCLANGNSEVLIAVSGRTNEVGLWNLMDGECEQVFSITSNEDDNSNLKTGIALTNEYMERLINKLYPNGMNSRIPRSEFNLDRLNVIKSVQDRIRQSSRNYLEAYCCPTVYQPFVQNVSNEPYLITGGSLDRMIRYWDLEDIENSFIFGMEHESHPFSSAPSFSSFRASIQKPKFHFHVTTSIKSSNTNSNSAHSNRGLLGSHTSHGSAISDIIQTKSPFPMVISGDGEGVIKIWK